MYLIPTRRRMKKLVLAVLMLLGVGTVSAQNYYYPVADNGLYPDTTRIELYGGMVLPQSAWHYQNDDVDLGTTGWTAGIGFYRSVTRVLTLGLDGNYAQFGDGDKRSDNSYYRTGAATALVAARINFFPRHSTRLYIPFGAGIGHMFVRQNKEDGSHQTYDSTKWAAMAGLGLEFDVDENIIFGVEGRIYRMELRSDMKETFGKGHTHYSEVMLKFGFRM